MTRNIRFHPVMGLKWRTTAEYLRWRPIMYVRRGVERSCPQGIGETGVVEHGTHCVGEYTNRSFGYPV